MENQVNTCNHIIQYFRLYLSLNSITFSLSTTSSVSSTPILYFAKLQHPYQNPYRQCQINHCPEGLSLQIEHLNKYVRFLSELLKESAKLYDLDPHSHNKNLMLMIFLMEQMIYHEHLSGNIRPLVCLLLVGYNHGCMKSPITLKKDTTSMLTSSS